MGTVEIEFRDSSARIHTATNLKDVKSVLVDKENETVSVLMEDSHEYFISLDDVHNIYSKGVEITYA